MNKLITIIIFLFTIATGVNAQKIWQQYKLVKPIKLSNVNNLTIKGDSINGGDVECITLSHCHNIRITHCFLGNSTKPGIFLYDCTNVRIDSVFMTNVASGVYAMDSFSISVTHCEGLNMIGPMPRGQFVQFDNVKGTHCRVNYNKFENILGNGDPEDAINIFKSNGTPKDPIQIIGNMIRGGGPSTNGGGIMLGDYGGSYQVAKNNVLVNPGQYGMAVAGGSHISIINNKIYAKQQPFTNVGLYIWAQGGVACSLNTVSGNQVNWTMKDGTKNDIWNPGNCGRVAGWDTNTPSANIDESILPAKLLSSGNK
ncbi:MAG: right-handed parallel beta-helix repeat-containing protein [Mucilaginibacter sp.]